ncbi:MAG: type ISP restriction/modification enzyme, partial [Pseudanabaena sp.]
MKKAQIYYARMDEFWRKEQKLSCLEKFESLQDVDWKEVKPDSKYTWLTEGSELDFEQFISIGNRSAKSSSEENQEVIFKLFSLGVSTNRDIWVRNFDVDVLANNIRKTIEAYNQQVSKWLNREDKAANVDGFVIYDDVGISWSSTLK